MSETLLEVKNLCVEYRTFDGVVKALNNLSFSIPKGKTVSLVGETGAGKTTVALSIMGLIPSPPGISNRRFHYFRGKGCSFFFKRRDDGFSWK